MYRLTAGLRKVGLKPDANPTRHALMLTAEYLMGEQGLDAPPLHLIVSEAGLGNKYAVQYHFADRPGLIRAIANARMDAIAQRRAELTLDATALGLLDDVGALIEAMFLPIIEQVGDREPSSFARFLLLDLTQPWSHKLMEVRANFSKEETTRQLVLFFERALPHLSPEMIGWRLRVQTRLILHCLVEYDNFKRSGQTVELELDLILHTLDMVTAAMKA
jgi:AcrR family transcriptional regulator